MERVRALAMFGGFVVALTLAAPAAAGAAALRDASGGALRVIEVASDFNSPVHVAAPSNEKRKLYVVEQPGVIRVLVGGKRRAKPFLDIDDLVSCCGEQGLLSVAFHPNYKKNRKFYVNYTNNSGNTVIAQFRANKQRTMGLRRTQRVLLRINQPFGNHNGGQIAFGKDGKLYIGTGDGGSGGDPNNVSQRLSSRLGKMLTLNVNRAKPRPKTVGYGLRNPWRFSFDRMNGDVYIGDVGQGDFEEIDYLPRGATGKPHNYGWDAKEGNANFEPGNLNNRGRLIDPIIVYSHSQGHCSVTGGHVYRGKNVPRAVGRYFYGDFCSGRVWSARVVNGQATGKRTERFQINNLSSFGEDARGELYLVSLNGGIFRLAG